ncbi:MAG: LysM peptidoglycan-binding domain-containing protein [Aggregatilineales bacterium]
MNKSPVRLMVASTLISVILVIGIILLPTDLQSTNSSLAPTVAHMITNPPQAIVQASSLTPLSVTPSRTLRPPPTFEPPTLTVLPSVTPTNTLPPTIDLSVSVPGLFGNETSTPMTTPVCKVRADWKLTYTVQRNDALIRIAAQYNTSVEELVKGNCLRDKNVIVIGQVLKVPGVTQPLQPEVQCIPFQLLTPLNGTLSISSSGLLTFDWRGPRAPHNLIRIFRPDGSKFEVVIDLRQNESIDLANLPAFGKYTWYVYPLNASYLQVCPEGGPWTFSK